MFSGAAGPCNSVASGLIPAFVNVASGGKLPVMRCVSAGQQVGALIGPYGREAEYACLHPAHHATTSAQCLACPDFAPSMDAIAYRRMRASRLCPHPPGVFQDRYGNPAAIADLYLGATAFLLLGGPSARELPLDLLARRGVLIFTSNNAAGMLPEGVRPHVMFHTDGTGKFHDSLWRDPAVLKLTPVKEWGSTGHASKHKGIFHRAGNGELRQVAGVRAKYLPNVLGFARNSDFRPHQWLWEPSINRGNDREHAEGTKGHESNGWPNVINTMFAALRIPFYMGVKKLYLLGCDFRMDVDRPYGFNQGKNAGGVGGCNASYAKMCIMFDALRSLFDAVGYEVVNCNLDTHCWSFDTRAFADAIDDATGAFEQVLNTKGWYDELTDDAVWAECPAAFQRLGF